MLYVLSLPVDTILLLVFAALFAGFVLALWLSVRRAKKKGCARPFCRGRPAT